MTKIVCKLGADDRYWVPPIGAFWWRQRLYPTRPASNYLLEEIDHTHITYTFYEPSNTAIGTVPGLRGLWVEAHQVITTAYAACLIYGKLGTSSSFSSITYAVHLPEDPYIAVLHPNGPPPTTGRWELASQPPSRRPWTSSSSLHRESEPRRPT